MKNEKLMSKFIVFVFCTAGILFNNVLAQVASHCSDKERVVFTCTTSSKKIISFCASSDNKYLQYRFGTSDKIELLYPNQLIQPKGLINAEVESMPLNDDGTRNENINLQFKINSFTYSLDFETVRNYVNIGKKQDIRENSSANLFVMKEDKQIAKLQCTKNSISNVSKSILRDFDILN